MTFESLNLIPEILKTLHESGYTSPTPIQQQAIPKVLAGKDLLACAQTGTGKTAAFATPILQILRGKPRPNNRRSGIRALILTPTRELAIQIDESIATYGRLTGIRSLVIFGGVSQHAQVNALQSGTDILVATPGRLLDLIQQGFIRLDTIEIFVLDEADRMLDMGFIHDVRKVLKHLPDKRQSLFFSATMPPEIVQLAGNILRDPERVAVTPPSSTAERINQSLYYVPKNQKKALLIHLLFEMDIPSALVFTRTKHGADRLVKDLHRAGIGAEAIHGNKSQNARQRALNNFKTRQTRILVATDIAARGIDVEELSHVINYEIPNIPETYVHRIGRTGRAGNEGVAVSFCDEEERPYIRDIHKLIARTIPVVAEHPFLNDSPVAETPAPVQQAIPAPRTSSAPAAPAAPRRPAAQTAKKNKKWYRPPGKRG